MSYGQCSPLFHSPLFHSPLLPPLSPCPSYPLSDAVFTPQWYAAVLSRLHLNSFRLLPMAPAVALAAGANATGQWSAAMWQAASMAVRGEEGFGSGLYLLPSLFNHDCGKELMHGLKHMCDCRCDSCVVTIVFSVSKDCLYS